MKTINSKIATFLISVIAASFAMPASAQDDDLIIIEDGGASTGGGSGASFSGEVIGSYFGGGDVTRSNGGVKLRYFQEYNPTFSAVLEGRAHSSAVDLQFERNSNPPTAENRETFSRSFTTSQAELNEGYFRVNRGAVDFYFGRRKQVLGQFDVFSPVDFLLPVDLSSSEVSFTKLDRKYPQTVASLYVYPTPKLELQLQYFPRLERDPATRELLETDAYREPESTDQLLARLVYTGEKLTTGFTFFDGYALYPETFAGFDKDASGVSTVMGSEFDTYPEFSGYGFELALPVRRALFKYEIMLGQRFFAFDECIMTQPGCSEFRDYLDPTTPKFNGDFFINPDTAIQAIGFDYLGSDWTINFALFNIVDMATAEEQAARRLSRRAAGKDDEDDTDNAFAPSFNFARHHGNNRSRTTGFAGGFFGSTAGASFYHIYKPSDNFTIIAAMEALAYSSDEQFESDVDDEESATTAELTTTTAAGIRLGFTYQF